MDDFKFVLRKDPALLGRVQEQLWRERRIKEERKAIDFEKVGNEGLGVGALEDVAQQGGVAEEMKKKKRKRRAEDVVEIEGGGGKRVAS